MSNVMTRLQLCQRLRQEAGIAGTGPTSTLNQTGELKRIVDWIDEAYEDIQDKRSDWKFLRKSGTIQTVIGQRAYAQSLITDCANWRNKSFRIYLTATGVQDERFLQQVGWDQFRDTRLYGSPQLVTGRPIEMSVEPDQSIAVWPLPDAVYTLAFEYYQLANQMTADNHVPVFNRYNMAIVWNALMRYAAWTGDASLYAQAQKEYGRLINKLELNWGSSIKLGGSLA